MTSNTQNAKNKLQQTLFVEQRLSCYFVAAVIFKMASVTLCKIRHVFQEILWLDIFFRELGTFAVCLPISFKC